MRKQYIKPAVHMVQACTTAMMAASGPKVAGSVYDRDGHGVDNGTFGYGGDGHDGDEGDAKMNDQWGDMW